MNYHEKRSFQSRHIIKAVTFEQLMKAVEEKQNRGYIQVGEATKDHAAGRWVAVVKWQGGETGGQPQTNREKT